ncbi:hypothetical protein ZIOFF_065524 [Zingiber officinale]|uniref:dUTP diphosphatase n=1 Tax=Zingiber officinale TaxID=94328 RepID=A0A8J5EX85_ZINOF|nr:hypothetical protein ZIOFF_065524 [Zingiber officinale]
MSNYIITRNTYSYLDVIATTDQIEAPAVGFAKPIDYQGTSANLIIIKQNNTQIQLLVQIAEALRGIQEELETTDKGGRPSTPPLHEDLIEKLKNLSLRLVARPKEKQGKLRIFIDSSYEAWHNREDNLLITRGLVGRLSNTPNVGFAYEIQGVVDYLTTHGVNALSGRDLSTRSLQGLNWVIQPTQAIVPMQPSEVNSLNLMDGKISLSFHNYTTTQPSKPPTYNKKDEEIQGNEDVSHSIAILVEQAPGVFVYQDDLEPLYNNNTEETDNYPFVLAHKLTTNAVIPIQRTPGAAGFDLAASEAQTIEPRGHGLVSTGLSLEIPWGSYERITARSSAVWKFGIDIGAGVINSDYKDSTRSDVKNSPRDCTGRGYNLQDLRRGKAEMKPELLNAFRRGRCRLRKGMSKVGRRRESPRWCCLLPSNVGCCLLPSKVGRRSVEGGKEKGVTSMVLPTPIDSGKEKGLGHWRAFRVKFWEQKGSTRGFFCYRIVTCFSRETLFNFVVTYVGQGDKEV